MTKKRRHGCQDISVNDLIGPACLKLYDFIYLSSKKNLLGYILFIHEMFDVLHLHASSLTLLFIKFLIITVHFTGKRCNSAKVFSALSWNRSARALQYSRDAVESSDPSEPCRPGAHCITLRKLYEAEKKLYKEIKVKII